MNIALISHSCVFAPFHGLFRWWLSNRSPVTQTVARATRTEQKFAPELIATRPVFTRVEDRKYHMRRPLRVVRVVEADQARSCVGRMVISGRMADVCAELDRLAARDAALM